MLNFCLPESSSLFSFSSSRRLQFHRHHMQNIWKSLWITVSMSYVDHQSICVGSCCTVSCQLATIINAVCVSGSRTRFSKYSMSGSSRIFMISSWYRKKNRIFWSCVVQITNMLLKTVKTYRRISGCPRLPYWQDFQNTPCPTIPYFVYFRSICVQYPIHGVLLCSDHQEIVKYDLEFAMLISTTARQSS